MKFIVAFIVVMFVYLWQDIINAMRSNKPKTYKELMESPCFASDEALKKKLTRNVDRMG